MFLSLQMWLSKKKMLKALARKISSFQFFTLINLYIIYVYIQYTYVYIHIVYIQHTYVFIYINKGVVALERQDYLKEAYRHFDDKKVYEQVPDDPSVLANTLIKTEKICLWGDLLKDTLDLFYLKMLNLQDVICYLKFTNNCMMCQEAISDFELWLLY